MICDFGGGWALLLLYRFFDHGGKIFVCVNRVFGLKDGYEGEAGKGGWLWVFYQILFVELLAVFLQVSDRSWKILRQVLSLLFHI